jgi:hypothetical protein
MRDIAERLITYEATGNNSSRKKAAANFPVCDKLRPHLATLMGSTGFRALLLRALARAEEEVPSLRAVQVNADGSLTGFDKLEMQAAPDKLAMARVVLVAQLLGLLAAFIGEDLTLRIVRDVWPQMAREDMELLEEGTE